MALRRSFILFLATTSSLALAFAQHKPQSRRLSATLPDTRPFDDRLDKVPGTSLGLVLHEQASTLRDSIHDKDAAKAFQYEDSLTRLPAFAEADLRKRQNASLAPSSALASSTASFSTTVTTTTATSASIDSTTDQASVQTSQAQVTSTTETTVITVIQTSGSAITSTPVVPSSSTPTDTGTSSSSTSPPITTVPSSSMPTSGTSSADTSLDSSATSGAQSSGTINASSFDSSVSFSVPVTTGIFTGTTGSSDTAIIVRPTTTETISTTPTPKISIDSTTPTVVVPTSTATIAPISATQQVKPSSTTSQPPTSAAQSSSTAPITSSTAPTSFALTVSENTSVKDFTTTDSYGNALLLSSATPGQVLTATDLSGHVVTITYRPTISGASIFVATTTLPGGQVALITETAYVLPDAGSTGANEQATGTRASSVSASLQTGNVGVRSRDWGVEVIGLAVGVAGVAWAL